MARPVLTLAALGMAGILVWRLLWGLLLPMVVGVMAVLIKIAFWGGVILLAIWALRRSSKGSETQA
jgi:hypothetical protein